MTGLASGTDLDGNGILQTSNSLSQNEFVSFDVTFKDNLSVILATYQSVNRHLTDKIKGLSAQYTRVKLINSTS